MNNLTVLTNLLEELNPPKKKAGHETWSLFYKNKRFSDVPVSLMLEHLESLVDDLNLSIIDLEEEVEDNNQPSYIDDDFELQCRSDVQHLFRSIMCFGDNNQKKSAVETILSGWDFSLFPEFSDEISAAAIMAGGSLDEVLIEELDSVRGDAENSIVRANTISTALARSSEKGRRRVLSVLHKFDEYHPEVVAVALMSSLDYNELWNEKDKQCIVNILDSHYCSYLGINEMLVQQWRKQYALEAQSWSLSNWRDQRVWDFQSLVKCLRWFAVDGRCDELYFRYVGRYFNGKNAMQSFWQNVVDFEDSLPLTNYGTMFCKIVEEKSNWVEQNFSKELERAYVLLVPAEKEMENPRIALAIVLMNISGFLSGLGGTFDDNHFIRNLRTLENKIDQRLCQTYSDANFTFDDESIEQVQMHKSLIAEAKNLWQKEFNDFANKCLENKDLKRRSEFKIEKALTKLGIEIVG